jgi:hypothetical protein
MTTQEIIEKLRATLPLGPNTSELLNAAAARLEELEKKRDEALAKGEQLKTHPTHPEPSRLEIAAHFAASVWENPLVKAMHRRDQMQWALAMADAMANALITAARGAK